jgi:hypothetical protein
VWYLAAKYEGHGFAKKKNADSQFYTTVLFMQKYLAGSVIIADSRVTLAFLALTFLECHYAPSGNW